MRYLITKPNEKPFFAVELTEELLTDSVVYDLVDDKYSTPGGWSKIKFDLDYKLELDITVKLNKNGAFIAEKILKPKTKTPKEMIDDNGLYLGLCEYPCAIDLSKKTGSIIMAECTSEGNFVTIKTKIQVFNEFINNFLVDICQYVKKSDALIIWSYREKCMRLLRKGKYNKHY